MIITSFWGWIIIIAIAWYIQSIKDKNDDLERRVDDLEDEDDSDGESYFEN